MLLRGVARALPGTVTGAIRPRRPRRAELDVEVVSPPAATAGVRVHAIRQTEWDAPTAGVVEGRLRPRTTGMTIGAFVVEHPSGPFLADAGLCHDCHTRHLADMPSLLRRLSAGPPPTTGLVEGVRATGVDPAQLQFALITHLHWDHVSGLAELPDLTARVNAADLPLAAADAPPRAGVVPATLRGVHFEGVHLTGPPVLSFPASHDVFGDGSVLLLDLSGHTPGHVGILLTLHSGRRLLLAGDAVWNGEQVRLARQRPSVARMADADPEQAYRTVVRLSLVPPEVTILPAHDRDAIAAAFADGPL